MNTAPETKPAAAEEQGVSPVTLIDDIRMRITAACAVANFLELAGDVSEANILISSLAPSLEKIPEPSAEAIGGAVRAIRGV